MIILLISSYIVEHRSLNISDATSLCLLTVKSASAMLIVSQLYLQDTFWFQVKVIYLIFGLTLFGLGLHFLLRMWSVWLGVVWHDYVSGII